MQKKQKNVIFSAFCVLASLAAVLINGFVFENKYYYPVCVAVIVLSLCTYYSEIERKNRKVQETVITASLTAVAVASRAVFCFAPQVKPVCAVVVICSVCVGGECGFLIGSLSMFLSNFIFGQGSWTPFQMLGMGLAGLICGLVLKNSELKNSRLFQALFAGTVCFVVYGLTVDINSVLFLAGELKLKNIITVLAGGIPFNLIHAVTTFIIVFIAGKPTENALNRVLKKYGMFI